MNGRKWIVAVAVAGLAIAGARATENGMGAYPNGAEGMMTGAVPPPGQYLINYMLYYHAPDIMNANGDKLDVPFDATVYADVVRLINVTKMQFLGASWAQHVFVPLMYVDLETPGGSADTLGLGDLIVDPCILAWHKPPFHWVVGCDVYVPTGKYEDEDIANVGRNYWTFEPVAAITYLHSCGGELSAKFMYDINTENTDTDYRSGQEFHADFVAAYHMKSWAGGLGGFYYSQVTDDRGDVATPGGPVPANELDGYRGEQWALGPQVSYQHKGMNFAVAWDREFATENKPEGDRFWFKFTTGL